MQSQIYYGNSTFRTRDSSEHWKHHSTFRLYREHIAHCGKALLLAGGCDVAKSRSGLLATFETDDSQFSGSISGFSAGAGRPDPGGSAKAIRSYYTICNEQLRPIRVSIGPDTAFWKRDVGPARFSPRDFFRSSEPVAENSCARGLPILEPGQLRVGDSL